MAAIFGFAGAPSAYGCRLEHLPCSGFAFGESGELYLIRERPGQMKERLSLNQFISYGDEVPASTNSPPAFTNDQSGLDLKEENKVSGRKSHKHFQR